MTQQKTIGQHLRDLRESAGLSLAEVGRRCVPPTFAANVAKVESNRDGTTIQLARRIAVALGHDLSLLPQPHPSPRP